MPSFMDGLTVLNEAAEIYGFDNIDDMFQSASFDSVVPGICVRGCGATEDLEPDGYCRCECGGMIKSVLLIGGII